MSKQRFEVQRHLDQVYVARIPRKGLRRVLGLQFSEKIQRQHVAAFKVMDSVNHALLEAPSDSNHVIAPETLLASARLSVNSLGPSGEESTYWFFPRGSSVPV